MNMLEQTDAISNLSSDSKFQENFFKVQSSSLTTVKSMDGGNDTQQVNDISKSIRKNLQTYETQLSKSSSLV